MIICLDVDYREDEALVAGLGIANWEAGKSSWEKQLRVHPIADYVPGQFYKRELPCLLALLGAAPTPPSFIVVDSYVWLGAKKPGLGVYLYEALNKKTPVIGVAKTHFHQAEAVEIPVLRGQSTKPLYVTSIGVDVKWAAQEIQRMDGPFRIPTALKRVDFLSKKWEDSSR